jgi:DNA-binding beta-propeller fold protein YncE
MSKKSVLESLGRACFICSAVFVFSIAGAKAADSGYHIVRRIPVGGEGNWDYLKVDPDMHRIYLSRGTHTMVVDEISGKVVGDIANTKGVHGIAIAEDLGKGFTSNGQANTVTAFDLKTLKTLSEIMVTGENPDWILYDPGTKRVFTFNGRTSNATAIDAASEKVVGTLALGGKPEEATVDGKGNIFVNLEDKSAMAEFDANTLTLKGTWPLAPCDGPSGIAMDMEHRRVFSACDKVMTVLDADTGKVVASPPIGGDPDGAAYDPGTGLAFASCREGLLSVIHEDGPDKYSVVANVMTQFGARTLSLDPKTHHVFTVTADFQAAPAPTADNPRPRPQMIPNSFVILELAQ